MGEFDAGYELTGFLVETLREDDDLHHLLWDNQMAKVNDDDARVWESGADLGPYGLAAVLPRVLVAVTLDRVAWEQSAGTDGPCTVYVHHFTPRDQSALCARLSKATDDVLQALAQSPTALSTRIMIAPLTLTGSQIKDRQPAFDEANRITNTYATRLVGVLV